MPPPGDEHPAKPTRKQAQPKPRGAKDGARGATRAKMRPDAAPGDDLRRLAEGWDKLPEAVRQAIALLLNAGKK